MQDKAYKDKFAISQSALKDWEVMAPSKWYKTWVTKEIPRPEAGASASFGTLLDCLMLTPNKFDKNFLVADIPLPSESIQNIVTDVLKHIKELNVNATKMNEINNTKIPMKELKLDYPDFIASFAIKHEYYVKQPARALNEVMNKGKDFFDFLVKTEGKLVVTKEDKSTADNLKDILLNHPRSRGFFIAKKDCRIVFQQRIFADLELSGFQNLEIMPMKGAIDIIHFNDKRKEVREADLKWTSDAFLFNSSTGPVRKFDYLAQHSVYDFLLREWLKTYEGGKYQDYTVCPPLNVVIDSDHRIPYLYTYNHTDLHIKRYGHEGMPWIKGWEQKVNEIAWHMDTQQWEVPREHYLNGLMNVKVFHK